MADAAKPRKTSQTPKLISTVTLSDEAAVNRFREVLIRFEGIPVDQNVVPPFLSGSPDPLIQEIWVFGLELESDGQTHTIKTFTHYADALVKAIMDLAKPNDSVPPDIQEVREGDFLIFTLGMGQPEQLRIVGPLSPTGLKTFQHERVLREFTTLLAPVTHLRPNDKLKPRVLGLVEDMDLVTTFAMPHTVAEYLSDYTGGLMVKLGETTLKNVSKKAHVAELERANARLALAKARTSVAQGLAALKI